MFSSLFAQTQRVLVISWLAVMVFVVSLLAYFSLCFCRYVQPRLLSDKIMRSQKLTPAILGVDGACIPSNDGSSPNGGKQRENLLPSRRIRRDETRLRSEERRV